MLDREAITRAVDLSQRGYRLMEWLGDSIDRGFISKESAHTYATLPEAARAWILRHELNLPPDARPPADDLEAFCNLFSTFLQGSFDLHDEREQRRHSPEAHCFCPGCSWLVDMRRLRPKKLDRRDKARADGMMREAVVAAARTIGVRLADDDVTSVLEDESMREPVALVAYGVDLLRRVEGHSVGPAQLALWRRFAWERAGSPKKHFRFTDQLIFEAVDVLEARVVGPGA